MGIMLKKEERRLQPRKERNKELCRLKYQVSFCMGTRGFGRTSEFFLDYCFGVCVHQLAVKGGYDRERIMKKKDKAFWCYCLKFCGCSSVKIKQILD